MSDNLFASNDRNAPVANNLTVDKTVRTITSRVLYATDFGFIDSPTADNSNAAVALFNSAGDGDVIDFCNVVWRIYDSVNGILSSTADPESSSAVPLASVPTLLGKSNLTIRNGGFYAANQGVSEKKKYYPSTIFIKNCRNIFIDNVIFESRGQNYGDADASLSLSYEKRGDFLAANGGHAIVIVHSEDIKLTRSSFRLCGSTASCYISSSNNVLLDKCFSNPSSLGYAAYCIDSWCGSKKQTGFKEHVVSIENCCSWAEVLRRREDKTTAVGESSYASKGGVVAEDPDVKVFITGGRYLDAYGNGGTLGFQLGSAFSTGSSLVVAKNCFVSNCSYVGAVNVTSSDKDNPGIGKIQLIGVTGDVGCGVLIAWQKSFSEYAVDIFNCIIHVTNTHFLGVINESSYVINMAQNIPVTISIYACKFTGAKQLFWKPNGATNVSYGGVTVEGGYYETNGYLCNVSGWGGNVSGTSNGMTIKGDAKIVDVSDNVDTYIVAGNKALSATTLCYAWFDFLNCEIKTKKVRNISGLSISNASNLLERLWYPAKLIKAYATGVMRYPIKQTLTFISTDSHMEKDHRITVKCDSRHAIQTPTAIVGKNGVIVSILGSVAVKINEVTGDLEQELYCNGELAPDVLVVGLQYNLI